MKAVRAYIHRLAIRNDRKRISRGFQVRIRKLSVTKWFGDRQHGGRGRAERAAIRFRNRMQRELYRPNG